MATNQPNQFRSEMARNLLAQSMAPRQIQDPMQTLGSLAQALVGGLMARKEQQAVTGQREALASALGSDPRIANNPALAGLVDNPQLQGPIAGALVNSAFQQPEQPQFDRRSAFVRGVEGVPEDQQVAVLENTASGDIFLDVDEGRRVQLPGSRVTFAGTNITGTRDQVLPDGAVPVSKKTRQEIEGDLLETQASVDKLWQIKQDYQPEFLQYAGTLKAGWSSLKDKAGIELAPEEAKFLEDFSTFRVNAFSQMNDTIRRVTGAALSEQEAVRIRKELPDPEKDGPTEYFSKMETVLGNLSRAQARLYHVLRNDNITINDVALSQMDNVINQRGREIQAQLVSQGMSEEEARQASVAQLRREFGLNE